MQSVAFPIGFRPIPVLGKELFSGMIKAKVRNENEKQNGAMRGAVCDEPTCMWIISTQSSSGSFQMIVK